MTEAVIKAALSDFDALWLTLWAECRSEPIEGIIAVASVIRNRANKPAYFKAATYKDVCLKPKQFSCWNPGSDRNHVKLMQLAGIVVGDYALRSTRPVDARKREMQYIAQGIMGGQLRSNVSGCDHYLTTALYVAAPPAWASGKTPAAFKGAHAFFELA